MICVFFKPYHAAVQFIHSGRHTHLGMFPQHAEPAGQSRAQRWSWARCFGCIQKLSCTLFSLQDIWPHCGQTDEDDVSVVSFRAAEGIWATLPSHLVMSSRVTTVPAFTAAFKQSAPTVSIAMIGTSVQPTSFRPWMTPQRRPPPPTDTSTAPGLTTGPREAATSVIILAWPCLGNEEVL